MIFQITFYCTVQVSFNIYYLKFYIKTKQRKISVGNETLIYHNKQKMLVKWMHISYLNHKIMKMFGENVDSNIPTKALVSDSFKI